ncbi:MAG: ATPase, T2SS/T4P/T4SS family [Nanoarchaeota archaeon]|nr:Flp pilus assembly complex ATPase component TadA [Nanoarchaeota archaeon]MBU1632123.1 Flp pilus assembly complex ATPase component TadA [Nanoarchaeota archaeon]MBU1876188.1 Flp pilus assembly complex ATPase component TadA [Nanoarchaeota archaeon]
MIEETYKIESEYFIPEVQIVSEKGEPKEYRLALPELSISTKAFLEEIKHELVSEIGVIVSEVFDPKMFLKLKNEMGKKAAALIEQKLPQIDPDTKNFLIQNLINAMFGLEDVEYLLNDPNLEEVVILSIKEAVRVYHKKYGWLQTSLFISSEEQIQNYSSIIGRRVGRQINVLSPLLDAHLVTGDRTNAVLYPISTKGSTITIRKFKRDPWTVTDLIKNKTCSSEVFALIWLAIQYEMNVLFSGGTASGKTTFMNICMAFVPPYHRLISIEQTRELQLPDFLYWSPLVTREPNPEGKGEVSMLDLLVNALRMRPDRIILGEVRRKKEAEVLFEAMHTGHSVYATLHANSISETIQRLIHPPIEIAANLIGAVDLNIVMFRDRRRGLRRPIHIGEFIPGEAKGEFTISPNILYRWKPTTDQIIPHTKSLRFFEDLSRNTGFTREEIDKDLLEKKRILDWMVKNNIRSIEEVGKIIRQYYLDKESLLKKVQ